MGQNHGCNCVRAPIKAALPQSPLFGDVYNQLLAGSSIICPLLAAFRNCFIRLLGPRAGVFGPGALIAGLGVQPLADGSLRHTHGIIEKSTWTKPRTWVKFYGEGLVAILRHLTKGKQLFCEIYSINLKYNCRLCTAQVVKSTF